MEPKFLDMLTTKLAKGMVFVFGLFYLICSNANAETLETKIVLEDGKSTFLLSEPIWLTYIVKNTGTKRETFHLPLLTSPLILCNSKGDTLKPKIEPDQIFPIKLISSQRTRSSILDITTAYELESEGAYTAQVVYYTMGTNSKKISSNKIDFKIVKPTGEEEKAYQLLKKAYTLTDSLTDGQKFLKRKELVYKYPNSGYSLKALEDIRFYLLSKADSLNVEMKNLSKLRNNTKVGNKAKEILSELKEYDKIVTFENVENKLELLYQGSLEYPDLARKSEIEGTVYVRYIIDTLGNVIDAKVIKSTHPLLDSAALKCVRQYKFTPAELHGKKVKTIMEQPIRFILPLK
ncbi:MAG: energy transducer TonB [bacterium]|nr:energy transducer TonB [bacterium]